MVVWVWSVVGIVLVVLLGAMAAYDRRARARGRRLVDPEREMNMHMARIQEQPEAWMPPWPNGAGGP